MSWGLQDTVLPNYGLIYQRRQKPLLTVLRRLSLICRHRFHIVGYADNGFVEILRKEILRRVPRTEPIAIQRGVRERIYNRRIPDDDDGIPVVVTAAKQTQGRASTLRGENDHIGPFTQLRPINGTEL